MTSIWKPFPSWIGGNTKAIETVTDDGKEYKVLNGTYYHIETSDSLVILLERLRAKEVRLRFHWGDTETGRDYGDRYDVSGTISRSTGPIKIPILIHNARSHGGGGILTHCIVKIRYANHNDGGIIYKHKLYHED